MAREVNKLTALSVAKLKKPGYHGDGAGLYLQISESGSKSWILRYKVGGKAREMGLGSLLTYSLAEARIRAATERRRIGEGVDPIDARRIQRQATALEKAKEITFDAAAAKFIDAQQAGWKSAIQAIDWQNTMRTYVSPIFGSLPVASIDTGLVLRVLEQPQPLTEEEKRGLSTAAQRTALAERRPIWETKTTTAVRLRGRIERILDWAKTRGYRAGENPARWRGHLDTTLPKPAAVTPVVNHPALPYAEMADFMVKLRGVQGLAPLLTEFIILTGVRTGEARGAQWSEFDLEGRLWTIPAERMKMGREHRVPLSAEVVRILESASTLTSGADYIFPGRDGKRPMSDMACLKVLERMGRGDLTVHGFRSTFRDWAAEQTAYPNHVIEMALAHAISNAVEKAYRRGDLFEKRAALMADWAQYCNTIARPAKVLPIRAKKEA